MMWTDRGQVPASRAKAPRELSVAEVNSVSGGRRFAAARLLRYLRAAQPTVVQDAQGGDGADILLVGLEVPEPNHRSVQ